MDKIKPNRILSRTDMIFAVIFAILVYLYASYLSSAFRIHDIEAIIIFSYTIQGLSDLLGQIHFFLLWLFPILYALYRFGTILSNNVRQRGAMLFTRTTQRGKWFWNLSMNLFLSILIYYGIQFVLMFCIGIIAGYSVTITSVLVILSQFVLTVFFTYMIVMMMNILSLHADSVFSLFMSLIVMVGSLLLTFVLLNLQSVSLDWLICLLPTTHSMIILHTDAWLPQQYMAGYIDHFPLWISLLYLGLFMFVLNVLGVKKIKKMDII